MLDIIIAIFLIYALFAGLVSGINELIVQMLEMRGKVLFEGIAMMLGELPKPTGIINSLQRKLGSVTEETNLTKSLYQHPLIDTLSQPGSKPSYISPASFSTALVQVLSNDGSLTALRQKLDDRNSHLGKLLGPMLDEANGDLEKFKAKVEIHFNELMDRVGGWYKRRAQAAMFIIGLCLAFLLNIDSIHIVQQLQKNPEVVEKLVQTAEKASATAKSVETDKSAEAVKAEAQNKNFQDEVKKLNEQIAEFKNLGLPIGWNYYKHEEKPDPKQTSTKKNPDSSNCFSSINLCYPEYQNYALSPIGWLLTALAGILGAPFWFDAISKLFAIRGTGKKPEESTATPATSSAPAVQVIVPPANNPAAVDSPLNDYESSRLNSEDIEGLQRALGIPEARINGKLSEELRNALREWQRITGRTVTGRFDEPTVLALLYPEA